MQSEGRNQLWVNSAERNLLTLSDALWERPFNQKCADAKLSQDLIYPLIIENSHSWKRTKSSLMRIKEKSEKVDLKLNIQKTKIISSGPITSWQIDEERMETVTDFIFLGSKIIMDSDCSHEIKRCLLLERKAMILLQWNHF